MRDLMFLAVCLIPTFCVAACIFSVMEYYRVRKQIEADKRFEQTIKDLSRRGK